MANPIVGKYASPTSIFETSNIQQHEIGTRGILADRSFRYAKYMVTSAMGPNKLVQMCPPVVEHVNENSDPWVAGAYSVYFKPASALDIQENEYDGGYIKLQAGTDGIGQIRKLRPHPFKVTNVATTLEIWDPVTTTTTGSEASTLIHNPWGNVVVHPTATTAPAAGVTMVNWPACATTTGTSATAPLGYLTTAFSTPNYTYVQPQFGWLQTWGVCSVWKDASTIVAGHSFIASGTTAGKIAVAVQTEIKQRIGECLDAFATDAVYATVFLKIAP